MNSSNASISVRPGRVLLVDKPPGPTSHDVVSRVRRAVGSRRVGHTGTLDPFASGLLLLCFDSATRLAEYLTGLDKVYEASMRLGERTDTLDPEGEVVERDDAWRSLDREEVTRALAGFSGEQDQVPPQYSAKKVGGEAMYRRARRGESVVLNAVRVRIHAIRFLEFEPPSVRFMVRCSSGTYVRALARDLGSALGTCASLTALRRMQIGDFDVSDAISPRRIEALAGSDGGERELGIDIGLPWVESLRAVGHLPSVAVRSEDASRLGFGQTIDLPDRDAEGEGADGEAVALHLEGRLVAIAERRAGRLRPRKVFVDA